MNEDVSKIATNLQPNCNKPLTIDQLRGMDGKPVLVVYDEAEKETTPGFEPLTMIALVEVNGNLVFLTNNLGGRDGYAHDDDVRDYGLTVYPYYPTNIDREAWEPCDECRTCRNCENYDDYDPYEGTTGECGGCHDMSNFEPLNFCYDCGRPLTSDGWAMLEKRLMGFN